MRLLDPTIGEWTPCGDRDIAMMMSGGVDSSVSALLLIEQGWNVVGITMKIPYAQGCDQRRSCCGMEAAYVCKDLGLPHYYVDVREDFNALVIERFREAYKAGQTPSPCVDCNTELKFDRVWNYLSESLGIAHLATGHYSQVVQEGGDWFLQSALDPAKDQSYFLYGIHRDKLSYLHFPIGGLAKPEVRRIAASRHLSVADRDESMELCFAGEGDYRAALGLECVQTGAIVDEQDNVIGQHNGIHEFTLGQRKGIGIAAKEPLYVVELDAQRNLVRVGPRESLLTKTVRAERMNVLQPSRFLAGQTAYGKIRSSGDATPCAILEATPDLVEVEFDAPVFAPAPGQRLVLYDECNRIIAGGVISP